MQQMNETVLVYKPRALTPLQTIYLFKIQFPSLINDLGAQLGCGGVAYQIKRTRLLTKGEGKKFCPCLKKSQFKGKTTFLAMKINEFIEAWGIKLHSTILYVFSCNFRT